MHRRESLASIGGYEPGICTSDDIELLTRLIRQTKLANLPKILYLYRQHGLAVTQ